VHDSADGKLTVLHLGKTSAVGGAPWLLRQTRYLVDLGANVHIVLPPGGPKIREYEAAGVTVHPLQPDVPLREPWRAPEVLSGLRRIVAEVRPDVIHSSYVGTTIMARLALGRHHPTPRVFQVPGPLHLEHPIYRRAEIATAGRADTWIATCQSIFDLYRQAGIPSERLFVSDHGVDVAAHTCRPKGNLRKELGIAADVKIVGMVGLMYAPKRVLGQTRGLKGHEDFIEALSICMRREPNMVGVIIGGAWNNATAYEARLREYGRRLCGNRAIFLGTRFDVSELLPDFDVAVQPSLSEGIPGTGMEAQLLGVPVVATNIGGLPDIIEDGVTGRLVPPHDPAQLAAAILDVLHDPEHAQEMARVAQERGRQRFDAKMLTREVFDHYHALVSDARNRVALKIDEERTARRRTLAWNAHCDVADRSPSVHSKRG
jgi:glycosyltransferase involved in cell wall biosynthesis